jgi:hypothetical protein
MNTIIVRTKKASRWAAILVAAVVAIITCLTVANATQTITTPNAAFITYNLAAGASSAAITPATNRSVLVMGCCNTNGSLGVGQVSLQHISVGGVHAIEWVGLESYATATITKGISSAPGYHIVTIDYNQNVNIETASADTILIHNTAASSTLAGNVTLIW